MKDSAMKYRQDFELDYNATAEQREMCNEELRLTRPQNICTGLSLIGLRTEWALITRQMMKQLQTKMLSC